MFRFESLKISTDPLLVYRDELRDAMTRRYGRKPSEVLLDTLIATLDINRDGEISAAEFKKFVEKRKSVVCYAGSGGAVGAPDEAADDLWEKWELSHRIDRHKF